MEATTILTRGAGDLVGFEALARYRHVREGVIGPGEFLELARHAGMLRALDLAILDAVCADLLRWRQAGLRQVPVAVNFSRATIKLPSTADAVAQIIARHDVAPSMLVVEIVEDGEFVSTEELRHTCERLVDAGVRVALDDFGTGRANLAALQDLKLHYLKVDRRFVHGVSLSTYAGGVLRLVAGFSELAGARMICEGVEDEADLRWAIDAGCRFFQGWYFSKAVNAEAAARMLARIKSKPVLVSQDPIDLHALVRSLAACVAEGAGQNALQLK
jgi:EAL domain-containing protein (putative c-di-GMP-specific phosphodiesterase class I)